MAKNFKNLSDAEKTELKELIAKKKAKTLTEADEKRLAELNDKCGFKGGKSNSSEGFKPGNDFSWWNKREELLKDAANYKCNYIAGEQIGDSFNYIVPGVMTIDLIDTFGVCTKQTDPLNVWSRDLFLRMFQKFRVPSGYSQADLGITMLATVMLFAMFAFYERVYGIINRYSTLNLNIPFTETKALGLTDTQADWLRTHLSDFRYDLNELISRAQRICVPKDISLLADKISLYGYEYLDHNSGRSQIIMFRPKYYATYKDVELTSGGSIRFNAINYGDDGTSFFDMSGDPDTNMCSLLEEMVDALLNSTSVVRIYADLITWFGEEAMLHLVPVPENYIVVPTYSESILHKLHNAESWFFGGVDEVSEYTEALCSAALASMNAADVSKLLVGYYVYQANDTIISKPVICSTDHTERTTEAGWTYPVSQNTIKCPSVAEHLLDTYRVDVDEETVTEGVLFKNTLAHSGDTAQGEHAMFIKDCAFEIPCGFCLYSTNRNEPVVKFKANAFDDNSDSYFAGEFSIIDWAPLAYNVPDAVDSKIDSVKGDVDNIVMIPNTGLRKLHRAVIYSGLNTDIKVIGK